MSYHSPDFLRSTSAPGDMSEKQESSCTSSLNSSTPREPEGHVFSLLCYLEFFFVCLLLPNRSTALSSSALKLNSSQRILHSHKIFNLSKSLLTSPLASVVHNKFLHSKRQKDLLFSYIGFDEKI